MSEQAKHSSRALSVLCWEGYNDPDVDRLFSTRHANVETGYRIVNSDRDAVDLLRTPYSNRFDLVIINNNWTEITYDEGLIKPLDEDRYRGIYDRMMDRFQWPYSWAHSKKDGRLLGLAQRFAPMPFVVNTDKIDPATARKEGYQIALEHNMQGRYGVLDWRAETQHVLSVMAGVNPFGHKSARQLSDIEKFTHKVLRNAHMIDADPGKLNAALLRGDIDMYLSGGTYTVSSLRREGYPNFLAVSPETGPVSGQGGFAWVELASVVNLGHNSPIAEDYLDHMFTPEAALNLARAGGTLNPISSMHEIKDQLTSEELMAIQYDDLEEHMSYCAEFAINPDYDLMNEYWDAAQK